MNFHLHFGGGKVTDGTTPPKWWH